MNDQYQELDFTVEPADRHGVALTDEICGAIRRSLSPLHPLISHMYDDLHVFTRRFFTEANTEAGVIIGNHALNDFESLVSALLDGDGRNAARVSRAAYEHLINYCEVLGDPLSAERYVAHRAVTADLIGGLTRGVPLLKGAEQKRERNRLGKLKRDSATDLRDAVRTHGAHFRRDWASRNLRDRAVAHGYGDGYDVYRLLSQVTHGSAGGVLGNYANIRGSGVHRTGPSLDLAILSYLEGLSFFRDMISEVQKREAIDTSPLISSLNKVIAFWPTYRSALQKIDKSVWPKDPPPGPVAVMAFYPGGGTRWFYWEPALKMMKSALPPEGADWMEQRLKERIQEGGFSPIQLDGKPFTSAVTGVHVMPRPNARWFRADAIFVHNENDHPTWVASHRTT